MSKSSTDHNNDGQKDASNGGYEPPHDVGDEFSAFCGLHHKSLEEVHDDNRAYRSGNDNGKK